MVNVFEVKSDGEQLVLTASKGFNRIETARLVAKKDMYSRGLEKNHKELGDMYKVAESLVNLLNNLTSCNRLYPDTYEEVLSVYQPFLSSHEDYQEIKTFL